MNLFSIKPISISLSPNTERDDVFLAFRLLFQPWRWKRGSAARSLERAFAQKFGFSHAYSFNSGRSAFLALLAALQLKEGDEVAIQAFTCNAVPNPILWAGLKPVYVDCDDNYNMDVADLERKITPRTRAVVAQHTFGFPAGIKQIQEICKKRNLLFIEDCAHALGATYEGKSVGTFGDAAFFSFSRDKIISSVYGGVVATNNQNMGARLRQFQKSVGYPSVFWVFQQLLHPVLMNMAILPTYRIFGKYLLVLLQQAHILSKAVHWKEKRGRKPGYFPKQLPNALAILANYQLAKLERFNAHRKEIADFYEKNLVSSGFAFVPRTGKEAVLRLPVRHSSAHYIIKTAWKQNILLGDWYTTPIAPEDTRVELVGYKAGMAPNAERLATITLNLPTHINVSKKDAQAIIYFLKFFFGKR